MEFLSLGTIIGSFGLDGSLKVLSCTHFAKDRYKKGNVIKLFNPKDNSISDLTVISYRHNGDLDIVKVEEINVKEDADKLKGATLKIEKDTATLPKNNFFFSDLESCDVLDQNNNKVGFVKKVEEFPAQITLRVGRNNKQDFFVPFISEFIMNVNISNKTIKVKIIEGML